MLKEEKTGTPPAETNTIKRVAVKVGPITTEEVAFYDISCNNGYNSWVTRKRYSSFEDLHTKLIDQFSSKQISPGKESMLIPPIPPKRFKFFTSHTSPQFLEERRILLENFLSQLIRREEFAKSPLLTTFLQEDIVTDVQPEFPSIPSEDSSLLATIPEDQEVTDVSIPSFRVMSDHILYQIDVLNAKKRKTFSKWTVLRRFQQFHEMDNNIRKSLLLNETALLPELPRREPKLFQDHLSVEFAEMRRALLESYLQKMLTLPFVARHQTFLSFLKAF